jgi:hypothetical protein
MVIFMIECFKKLLSPFEQLKLLRVLKNGFLEKAPPYSMTALLEARR